MRCIHRKETSSPTQQMMDDGELVRLVEAGPLQALGGLQVPS